MTFRSNIRKMIDLASLTCDLVINNRKLILPTMIGLVLALTVISETYILVESSRTEFFDDLVFNSAIQNNPYFSDISIELSAYNPEVNGADRFSNFSHYDKLFNSSVTENEYSKYVSEHSWFSKPEISLMVTLPFRRLVNFFAMTTSSLHFFDQLNQSSDMLLEGRLPKNGSEVIVIRPQVSESSAIQNKYLHNLTIGSSATITVPDYLFYPANLVSFTRPNKTVKIVGIVETSSSSSHYNEHDPKSLLFTKYLNHTWTSYALLTLPSFLNEILDDIYPDEVFNFVEINSAWTGAIHMRCKVFLDPTQFDVYQSKAELQKIESFISSIGDEFDSKGYNSIVKSEILKGIRGYEKTSSELLVRLFIIGSPVLGISLYLMIYSFGLIRHQRQKQIGIIKTRGGSLKQILFVLIGEMTLSTFIAAIIGFIISLFLANLVLRSSNYVEFLGSQIEVRTTIEMLLYLIFIGLLLALLLNIHRIIKMSRQEIEETIVPIETKSPFWKRFYLDVFIFIIGTVIWTSVISYLKSLKSTELTSSSSTLPQIILILAPLFIFIGSLMILGRLFYFTLKRLAKASWRIDWGIFSLAIHNLVRYKHAANRAVLLLTLAVSFSIVSSALIFSLDRTENLRLYSTEGADLSISMGSSVNLTTVKTLRENVSHLTSVSIIYTAQGKSISSYGSVQDYTYDFLFVDVETYANTVRVFPEYEISGSLPKLMNELADNRSILIHEKNLRENEGRIGFGLSLPTWSDFLQYNYNRRYTVVGTFTFWPTFYPEVSADFQTNIMIIGSLGLFEIMKVNGYLPSESIEARCLLKADSLKNIETIVKSVEKLTNYPVFVPELEYDEYEGSFTRRFNLSILNTDLIICITIAIVGMIMFAFFTFVERGKEIGVERTLGITRFQSGQLFLIEAAVILSFGVIFGFLTGIYFTTMFLQITQIGSLSIPIAIVYPIQIIPMLMGIFFLAGIGTLLPAYLASRTDISRILKVE